MKSVVLQIIFIVLACWVALSLVTVPLVLLLGRAGRRADTDAAHLHAELAAAREVPVRADRVAHRRASQA